MAQAVICIIRTQLQVEEIITRLRGIGIGTGEISLVLLERNGLLGLVRDRDAHINGSKAREVAPSGPIGGVMGMLTGIGTFTISGAGVHITAGPLASRLAGDRRGAAAIGIVDSLAAVGVSQVKAREFEQQVRQGGILLGVHTMLSGQIGNVTATLSKLRAEDILVSEEHAPTGVPV